MCHNKNNSELNFSLLKYEYIYMAAQALKYANVILI